ncbi:hypothetical protein ABW21_db0205638 [Orbilia brochopaga]|nr:hypothetical protein ABW21_db0205638 [Drechslerella brochopaga]
MLTDSKKLTPASRVELMQSMCVLDLELEANVGWAVRMMSARDIGAGMLRPAGVGVYNLNAQAHDATIDLIQEVVARGVNVKEIYVDTVGPPTTYQAKLARKFPSCKVTVSKKADSLYPSVSVASVAAKVSRDYALEQYFKLAGAAPRTGGDSIGSGYPSDPKTVAWLRNSLDEVFGWGSDTRFSWSTAAEMLKKEGESVEWLETEEGHGDIASLMLSRISSDTRHWYGRPPDLHDLS